MIISSRSERRVSMISVRTCAVSAMTASLRLSDSARSFSSYSSSSLRIEPLELRLVPEDVGLLGHFDRTRDAMPDRQRIADVLEDRAAAATHPPALAQARARTARSCRTRRRPRAHAAPARRSSPAPRRPGSAAPATGFAGRSGRPAESGRPFRRRARWWRSPPRAARTAPIMRDCRPRRNSSSSSAFSPIRTTTP